MEDDGRLNDPLIRENFILQIFTMNRWRDCLAKRKGMGRLVDFHTRHKFSVLAHDEPAYRELGRLVADAGGGDIAELAAEYVRLLMLALARIATAK